MEGLPGERMANDIRQICQKTIPSRIGDQWIRSEVEVDGL